MTHTPNNGAHSETPQKAKRGILAGCDLSEYSVPVLQMAGRMAGDLKRDLIVAHVIHHRDIDSVTYAMRMEGLFGAAPSPEEFVAKLTQERVREIQGLISRAGAGRFMPKLEIVVGNPFEALLKLIETRNVYLAVIGTKGRGKIDEFLAGSTAEKLLKRCPIPLLCVPKTTIADRPESGSQARGADIP